MANQDLQSRLTSTSAFSITPNDVTVIPPTWGGLWVGGAGNVVVTTYDGDIVTFTAAPAGTHIRVVAIRVRTATTATNIVGLA